MSSDSNSSSSYQDYELEQEQKFTGVGRIAGKADDLEAELRRLEKEFHRVIEFKHASSFLFAAASIAGNSTKASSLSTSPTSVANRSNNSGENRAGINSIVPIQVREESHDASRPYIGVGALSEINLVPKRNLGWASWNVFSNAVVASKHSLVALFSFPVRQARDTTSGPAGKALAFCTGSVRGVTVSLAFLGLGFIVSPLIHVPLGISNNVKGLRNMFTCDRTFDVYSGSYRPVNIEEDHRNYAALYSLEQRILLRGNRDHKRQKMFSDIRAEKFPFFHLMKDRLGNIGGLGPKSSNASNSDAGDFDSEKKSKKRTASGAFAPSSSSSSADETNYYKILRVPPTASEKQIKLAYGKLAKIFHPDMDPSPKARKEFDKVTKAYQTLVNPQLRKAYDAGGASFAEATKQASRNGSGASGSAEGSREEAGGIPGVSGNNGQNVIMHGTPMEVFQRIFGGAPFEQLIFGPVYRSMFHMRAQGLCRVNLHNYEVVETLRMLRLATFLSAVLDAYAMSDEALAMFVLLELEQIGSSVEHIAAKIRPHAHSLRTVVSGTNNSNNNMSSSCGSSSSPSNKSKSSRDQLFAEIKERSSSSNNNNTNTNSSSNHNNGKVRGNNSQLDDGENFPSLDSFRRRGKDFALRLSKCCFGKELLHEVGESYVINAKRYLGECPLWKPRALVTKKTASGMHRLKRSITGTPDAGNDPTKILTQEDLANFFSIEFDNVVCNLHMIVRFVAITAVKDTSVASAVELALFPTFSSLASVGAQSTQRADPDGSHAVCPRTLERILSSSLSISDRSKLFLVRPRGGTSNPFKEIISNLKSLPEKERRHVRDGVAARVSKARLIALKELGTIFVATGSPWRDKALADCVQHIREVGTSPMNTTMPQPF